jgi:hypothetical protein
MTREIDARALNQKLESYSIRFRRSTKWWSVCLYSSLFGAALLSALAGVIPQLHFSGTKDLATGLAIAASLITTLNGLGRFDQKWRASRLARAHTEALQISRIGGGDLATICHSLEQIIIDQSQEVAGTQKHATGAGDGSAQVAADDAHAARHASAAHEAAHQSDGPAQQVAVAGENG